MWQSININSQNIQAKTERATLIKMPNKSIYKDFVFWHPSKLIRSGRHSSALSLSFTEDFTFNLFKNGKGKTNFNKKIAEKSLTADEFSSIFSTMDSNIKAPL